MKHKKGNIKNRLSCLFSSCFDKNSGVSLSLRHFFCQKMAERRRKSSLTRQQAALIFLFAVIYYFTEGDHLMAESKLRTLSIDFAVQILNLVKFLKSQHETIVSNQIGRAGTSIGANIHEAQYAHGKPDFIVKLQIEKPTKQVTGWNCC